METHPRYLNAALESVPEILHRRTCLYVGVHPYGGCALIPELRRAGYRTTFLEIWKPYVDGMMALLEDGEEIVCGDLRTWEAPEKYDLTMWWHGPEHMAQKDWEKALENLDSFAKSWCVVAGPWGQYGQAAIHGNPHQEHVSQLTHKWFSLRGWCVATHGTPNAPGGEIVAWRKHR